MPAGSFVIGEVTWLICIGGLVEMASIYSFSSNRLHLQFLEVAIH